MKIQDAGLSFSSLSRRASTNRIIIHHAEANPASPQQIHSWHKANGWSGAGYHFLVRKDGSVYALRPEWAIGAHASGANSDSLGICFEGRYDFETMPDAQLNAGRELLAHLKSKYGISKVQPHKEVRPTSCPGKVFPYDALVNEASAAPPEPEIPRTVVTRDYNPTDEYQKWFIRGGINDGLEISVRNAGNWCWLSDPNSSTASGTKAQTWEGAPSAAQVMIVEATDRVGVWKLHPKVAPHLSLDVSGGNWGSGEAIQFWENNETAAQEFYIYLEHDTGKWIIVSCAGFKPIGVI